MNHSNSVSVSHISAHKQPFFVLIHLNSSMAPVKNRSDLSTALECVNSGLICWDVDV